ncbi:monofunctional biosynthetic peptidoglycan transglycosylase [Leptolyngbya sp. AN03gr2]|uniref:monofunctional biosynthetic peptidoglycan transglycosylase n=1 Tax=unclassified Leptolyngbya TaxID=2650499 RepID=UPI003D31158D
MPRLKSRRRFTLKSIVLFLFKSAIVFLFISIALVLPLRWIPPITSSFMLQSAFFSSGGLQPYSYQWRSFDQIAPSLALAAISAEDQRFPDHQGFDFQELQNAIGQGKAGEGLRGASTITQQVAKNLYLWSGRNLLRKALEAWFTVLIERSWSKQRILEVYLNIAQFGDRTFGAEAASRRFFQINANQLNQEESALLAAVLPGPEIYFVDRPSATVLRRQAWILQQMEQLGLDYLSRLRN